MLPRVIVLTPTYNRADLLPQTIESVLRQTFVNFEYVIVSDGSTDGTRQVVERYMREDRRIRFVDLPHQGLAATWDVLFGIATGNAGLDGLVAWLSDDDMWDETFLEKAVRTLDQNLTAVVAYSDYRRLVGGELVPDAEPRRCSLNSEHLAYGCFISMCLAVIRCSYLVALKNLRGSYLDPIGGTACGDWVLFLNLHRLGPFVHVCEPLGTLRMHPGQDSVTTGVLELAYRRFLVRRKYAGVSLYVALREAAEIVVWGTYNRWLARRRQAFK